MNGPGLSRGTAILAVVGGLVLVLSAGLIAQLGGLSGDALFAFVLGIASIAVVGTGAILTAQTVRPIEQLQTDVEQFTTGQNASLPTDREDAIGELARTIETLERERVEAEAKAAQSASDRQSATERLESIEATLAEYRAVLEATNTGDLTRRMDPDVESDALAALGTEFNETMADLERTIEELQTVADGVATSAETVTEETHAIESTSTQVSRSIETISHGANRQHENLATVGTRMDDLSTTIEEIAASSNQVAELAGKTAESGRRGRVAAKNAIDGIEQIESVSETAVGEIEQLADEIAEIDELIEFITEVADQTNLLALNANIEASRSGSNTSDGEGFSVVADEVKELAVDTKEAAEAIEQRLERIQRMTDTTVSVVRDTGEQVAENADTVDNVVEALDEIAVYSEKTDDGIREITTATEAQAANTQEVVAVVDEVTTIAERTSEEAANVATAAQDQNAAISRVAKSASDLTHQSEQLSSSLEAFNTDVEVDVDPFPGEWIASTETVPAEPDASSSNTVEDRLESAVRAAQTTGHTSKPADRERDTQDTDTPAIAATRLRQAVIDAYPGDEPPWHALARIQLKTGYDLEDADPNEQLRGDRYREVVAAAHEITDGKLDLESIPYRDE
ncbi:methyl-accepting chemotaxis protein [Natrialbaceae archaeon A-CW2]|uniref:methyl-accepting chemotaxis protein n=1 Tax=Natronosalvus amylolyticus TaxID=2961994 RepID=UPI0020C98B62|nr:methyl-accepting chemotaxis protein [Natronosalvus amylolyticus]